MARRHGNQLQWTNRHYEETSDTDYEDVVLCPAFPYNEYYRNSWFTQGIRDGRSNGLPKNRLHRVDILNIDDPRINPLACIKHKVSVTGRNDGEKFYFHGTLACYVQSIIEGGINLYGGKPRLDFSNGCGFYVTDNPLQAVKWANMLAKSKGGDIRRGVVVFKISRALQTEGRRVNLYGDSKKKEWLKVVTHYRNGENNPHLKRELADVKVIEGPVSFCQDNHPEPYGQWRGYTQLCMLDEDYASRFGCLQNIPFAVCF